jgi:hypothetical protein
MSSYGGLVTDATTSAPIAGATVRISTTAFALASGRFTTQADSSGKYSLSAQQGDGSIWFVSANGYENDFQFVRTFSQDFHLYPLERLTAGGSTVVTIAPTDSLCVNNVQDDPTLGPNFVCRTVRVMVATDGTLTVEAIPTQGSARPGLEVEPGENCCQNPTSIPVTAGTDVMVNVEMSAESTTSQSFMLNTSIARP